MHIDRAPKRKGRLTYLQQHGGSPYISCPTREHQRGITVGVGGVHSAPSMLDLNTSTCKTSAGYHQRHRGCPQHTLHAGPKHQQVQNISRVSPTALRVSTAHSPRWTQTPTSAKHQRGFTIGIQGVHSTPPTLDPNTNTLRESPRSRWEDASDRLTT